VLDGGAASLAGRGCFAHAIQCVVEADLALVGPAGRFIFVYRDAKQVDLLRRALQRWYRDRLGRPGPAPDG